MVANVGSSLSPRLPLFGELCGRRSLAVDTTVDSTTRPPRSQAYADRCEHAQPTTDADTLSKVEVQSWDGRAKLQTVDHHSILAGQFLRNEPNLARRPPGSAMYAAQAGGVAQWIEQEPSKL